MGKEQWIDNLRKRMADHQEPPPEGLWREIASSLDAATPRRGGAPWRRWAAAAAVAAVVAGGGIWWYSHPGGSEGQVAQQGSQPTHEVQDIPAPVTDEPVVVAQNMQPVTTSGYTPSVYTPHAVQPLAERSAAVSAATPRPSAPTLTETNAVPSAATPPAEQRDAAVESAVEPVAEPAVAKQEQEILQSLNQTMLADSRAEKKGSGATDMSLYAANDVVGGNVFSSAPWDGPQFLRAPANVRKETHHFQPFSFGLSLGIPLSHRLKLNTGAVYTLQRSDFTYKMKAESFKEKQTLHYLGIPVTLSSQLWQNRHFSAYALAGGQVDFNVSARSERNGMSHTIEKDGAQFSATLGLGAQYNFLPYLGVYVEPTAKYYFDNGSDISNSFKDTPFNFNLHVGLRYNINK